MLRYSGSKKSNKKNIAIIISAVLSIVILLVIFIILMVTFKKHDKLTGKYDSDIKVSLERLQKTFGDKNYLEVIKTIDSDIPNDPFNYYYLKLRGFSYLMLGEDEANINERTNYFNVALTDLRKALAVHNIKNSNIPRLDDKRSVDKNFVDIYIAIGKIYYYFGEYYYKQSIQYLEKAEAAGSDRKDLIYLQGVVYSYVGDYDKAIKYLKKIAAEDVTDYNIMALAFAYFKSNDFENAQDNFKKVIDITLDPGVKEKAYLALGEIYFNNKKYEQSLDCFNAVLDINENNSSAYYFRGEIYYLRSDFVKARNEWRKTLSIDPSHILANKRLYY